MRGATALVCGSAATLLEDYYRAKELRPDADTIIVNDVSEILKGDLLYTLHPEKLDKWVQWQKTAFGHTIPTYSYKAPADFIFPLSGSSGSSGWSGAKLGLLMGYPEVILCGVPLLPIPYSKRGPAQDFMSQRGLDTYRRGVLDDLHLHAQIKSMSGWTREVLGEPV